MSLIMSQIEFAMEKTYLIHEMNTKEMTNYEQLYKEIGKSWLIFPLSLQDQEENLSQTSISFVCVCVGGGGDGGVYVCVGGASQTSSSLFLCLCHGLFHLQFILWPWSCKCLVCGYFAVSHFLLSVPVCSAYACQSSIEKVRLTLELYKLYWWRWMSLKHIKYGQRHYWLKVFFKGDELVVRKFN